MFERPLDSRMASIGFGFWKGNQSQPCEERQKIRFGVEAGKFSHGYVEYRMSGWLLNEWSSTELT